MIWLFGDLHRDGSKESLLKQVNKKTRNLSEDTIIFLGDFGGVWYGDNRDDIWIQNLERELPFKYILFIDGNHENHAALKEKYNKVELFGSPLHKVSEKTYHLIRGNIYTIEHKKIFVMGGARSIDKHLRSWYRDWWEEEIPSFMEMKHGVSCLEEHNNKVDYILTHDGPQKVVMRMMISRRVIPKNVDNDTLRIDLQYIEDTTEYTHWYFGHHHRTQTLDDKHTVLYDKLLRLGDTISKR